METLRCPSLLALSLAPLLLAMVAITPVAAQPVRLAMPAFGDETAIEIHDLNRDRAREAATAALHELHRISELVQADSGQPGSIGMLNADAGNGAQPIDDVLVPLLQRAQSYCFWSNGALGPAGGGIYRVVERMQAGQPQNRDALRSAIETARCDALRVVTTPATQTVADPASASASRPTVEISGASRLDLRGWARGFAIDRAMAVLEAHGVVNAFIESGPVRRGIGDGPTGQGWLAVLSYPGVDTPVDQVWLRDQALAIGLPLAASIEGRGSEFIDHRSGRTVTGVVAVVAVSELAVDAQALTYALAVLGLQEGNMRISDLKPKPSAIWLLGEGSGPPLRSEYRWSAVAKARLKRPN